MGVFYHQAGDSLTMGLPFYHFRKLFLFISLVPLACRRFRFWCQPPVKCNDAPIITLKLTLTLIRSMLILKHNKGEQYVKQ